MSGAFKLTHVASAYYKGDEKNPQLQRIYGTAFKNKTEMDAYFAMLEEAKKRDHRKLGKEMELFTFDDDVGPGLPLWLPNGTVLIEELEKLAKETEFAAGYERVRTPHLARESLYITSGHLPYYAESMFPPMELHEQGHDASQRDRYYLKAMNCPHHHKLFAAVPRSYRELPLRLAEYGTCYRYEQSGELFGLMRVRSMQMNDAHIYCTEDQFEAEFNAVNEMYLKYFQIFGIDKYLMRFSTHDPGDARAKIRERARTLDKDRGDGARRPSALRHQLYRGAQRSRLLWPENRRAGLERHWPRIHHRHQPGRFRRAAPLRARLQDPREYRGHAALHPSRAARHARALHRLPHRALRRQFPLLARAGTGPHPAHRRRGAAARVFAQSILAELRAAGIRAAIDASTDKINGKVLRAEEQKVHTMLVIGRRDLEAGAVSVRIHGKGNLGAKPRAEVIADLIDAANTRRA